MFCLSTQSPQNTVCVDVGLSYSFTQDVSYCVEWVGGEEIPLMITTDLLWRWEVGGSSQPLCIHTWMAVGGCGFKYPSVPPANRNSFNIRDLATLVLTLSIVYLVIYMYIHECKDMYMYKCMWMYNTHVHVKYVYQWTSSICWVCLSVGCVLLVPPSVCFTPLDLCSVVFSLPVVSHFPKANHLPQTLSWVRHPLLENTQCFIICGGWGCLGIFPYPLILLKVIIRGSLRLTLRNNIMTKSLYLYNAWHCIYIVCTYVMIRCLVFVAHAMYNNMQVHYILKTEVCDACM